MTASIAGLFFTSVVVAFSGAVMPGPLFTATIAEAGRRGFIAGPLMILGHGILELALVLALLAGLAPVLRLDITTIVFSCIGGAIMIILAWGMFRSLPGLSLDPSRTGPTGADDTARGATGSGGRAPVLSGILFSLSNPYWFVWWATIGLAYIGTAGKYGFIGVAAFFTGHLTGDLIWYSFVSAAVAGGRKLLTDRAYRILIGLCAAALLVFALQFIVSGSGRLIGLL